MQKSLPTLLLGTMWLVLIVLLAIEQQVRASVANPAIRPQSQRGIIFPKESFDACYVDEHKRVVGICKLLEDCPGALKRWEQDRVLSKTCYFVKFDQYICCAPDDCSTKVMPVISTTTPSYESSQSTFILRSSEKACEDGIQFGISIVGGQATKPREFPFMAALGWNSNFDLSIYYNCGGSVISPTFVLTAAHCINLGGQMPSTVRLGGDNLTQDMGADYQISRVFVHPGYSDNGAYNDIALIELDVTKPWNSSIACLWPTTSLSVSNFTAIGYGQTRFAGLSSAQLLKVPLQSYTNEQCQQYYPTDVLPNGLADSQLCAGDMNAVGDTCQGDSGGPLLMKYGPTWYVIGITSLGQGCASGPPSVYTRVSSYLDWIEAIVWPNPAVKQQPQPTFDLRISR